MSSRAIHIARARAKLSRDCALVMCFYMRLEKHVRKAMSQDRLLALAVVSSDQLINFSTFVRHMLLFTVRIKELSYLVRRLFLSNSRHIVYFLIEPESKGGRNSFAGGIYPIPDDIRVSLDSRSESESRCTSFEDGFCSFLED